ncbi:MAG: TnpV protein [Lachnospiraceae bacterium]|nr:TnpV protein [Lachnospiraceae bacterium]
MPEEQDLNNLGKYGRMALNYLKENRPERYKTLFRLGTLEQKMKEVNVEANSLLDQLMESYLTKHRAQNPSSTMEMWKIREQAKMEAEEIVLNQVVLTFH